MPAFLTDFGLAKATATGSTYTRAGDALGTPAYMSPEQARGEVATLTPATDVWSLGCVLYELLAGRRAFPAEFEAALGRALLGAPPPRLATTRADLPAALDRVVFTALVASPARRYASARALAADLDRVLAGRAPTGVAGHAFRAAAAAALALAGAAAVGGAWLTTRDDGRRAVAAPTDPEVESVARAATACERTDPARAARLLAGALGRAPHRHDLRLRLGTARFACGDRRGAEAAWADIPPDAPEGRRARLCRGLAALAELDGDAALVHFGPLAGGGDDAARLAQGMLALVDRDWRTARRAVTGLSGWEAAAIRAYCEEKDPDGDRGRAIALYGEVLVAGGRFGWALNNRGALRRLHGDPAGAVEDLSEALAVWGEVPETLQARGEAYHALGEFARARADFDRVLALAPRWAESWYSRGHLRDAAGDLAGAEADFLEAQRLDPKFVVALEGLGVVRYRLGRPDEAAEPLARALALDPTRLEAQLATGMIAEDAGDLDAAERAFDAAIARAPGDPRVWECRASVRWRREAPELARPDADRALALRPRSASALYLRGNIRRALDDIVGAREDFAASAAVAPDRPEAWFNLMQAHATLGEWAGAADAARRFLGLAPHDPDADVARAALAEAEAALDLATSPK